MQTRWWIYLALPFLLLTGACSEFNRIQKSSNVDLKYKAALKYYEEKDYYRASLLLEEVIPLMRGRAEAEQAQFYQAYAQYYLKQLVMSAFYFKSFFETYPRSPMAEEARFMQAVSLYEDSPKYNLDQANTYEAITSLENFLNLYPNSQYRERSYAMLDQLRAKLERKAFENAALYHKRAQSDIRYFESAVIALGEFSNDFPDSPLNEEALYLKLDAQYQMARLSTSEKKRERYFDAIATYEKFIDKYPDSQYVRTAESLYDRASAELNNPNARR
ncbi:outer membrane protein assembly factor BamD [Catalinimonas alkaloidigena]|uniref:Outer membrane protein assembly factor BamD n=1 Tax=Catalinimonas alkaloidigena TaxID=1075417 RepID=A0A1G8W9X0_9BACT|nr:outer membrane protein assembly factor BamD [Catalinimonas alkaloidigena]SDJ75064.1 outer membrane protein assembly factor BamD [Catalinimonas alkaloidigena]